MKHFLFVSDFDGTISQEDFYKQIMYRHMPQRVDAILDGFRTGGVKDIDLLGEVFAGMNLSEEELEREIAAIPIDPGFAILAQEIRESGGDFMILSAGCGFYIQKVLHRMDLSWIPVYSNSGCYKNRGLHLAPDTASPFYSARYGIDKAKVVQSMRKDYEIIAYAGDSSPDVEPCKLCDLRYAKSGLIGKLERRGIQHTAVEDFAQIRQHLQTLHGW